MFGKSHDLFVDARLYIVSRAQIRHAPSVTNHSQAVSAIFIRKGLSLGAKPWKRIPWRIIPKQPKDTMADMLLDIGSLLQRMDQARTYGTTTRERDKLMEKAVGVNVALGLWYSSLPTTTERFDYTKITTMPTELTRDRDISLLYLANLYWCACILIQTTIGFINQIKITRRQQNPLEVRSSLKSMEKDTVIDENIKSESSEREILYTSILESAAPYAYKIAHSCHLLLGPRAGVCINSMSVVPISLALSILTACEPATEASPERRQLACLFTRHALKGWVTEFAEATDTVADKEDLAKARRFRWWTKGLSPAE